MKPAKQHALFKFFESGNPKTISKRALRIFTVHKNVQNKS